MMPERCRSCYYFSVKNHTCDYILIAGHSRGTEISDCNVYRPKTNEHPIKRYIPGIKKSRDSDRIAKRDAAMLALYNDGYNDSQIAAELSCGPETVRRWRSKAGLPTQKERQEGLKDREEKQEPQ